MKRYHTKTISYLQIITNIGELVKPYKVLKFVISWNNKYNQISK